MPRGVELCTVKVMFDFTECEVWVHLPSIYTDDSHRLVLMISLHSVGAVFEQDIRARTLY